MSKPRFRRGNQVRVIADETALTTLAPDYGGWVGTVKAVEREDGDIVCLVVWPDEVLAAADPVYREIWARDDDADGEQWFLEDQLEPHAGEVPLPPSAEEFVRAFRARDVRVAAALGVSGPEEFPSVDEESLAVFHAYLSALLEFPFEAQFSTPPDLLPPERPGELYRPSDGDWYSVDVTVIGLVPWEEHTDSWEEGLLCRALEENRPRTVPLESVEVKQQGPNRQLIEDYQYWYFTWNESESVADTYGFEGYADDEDDFDDFAEGSTSGDDEEDNEEQPPGGEFAVEDYLNRGAVVSHEAATPPPRQAPVVRDGPRVGRNDDCPCGSGQKFKKCCLRRSST